MADGRCRSREAWGQSPKVMPFVEARTGRNQPIWCSVVVFERCSSLNTLAQPKEIRPAGIPSA